MVICLQQLSKVLPNSLVNYRNRLTASLSSKSVHLLRVVDTLTLTSYNNCNCKMIFTCNYYENERITGGYDQRMRKGYGMVGSVKAALLANFGDLCCIKAHLLQRVGVGKSCTEIAQKLCRIVSYNICSCSESVS